MRRGSALAVLTQGSSGETRLRVGRVFGIVLVGAALQLLTQTLLARGLSKTDVGVVSLLIGVLPLLSTLSLLGQDSATVRFITRSDASAYDLGRHFRRVLLFVLPLGAVAAVVTGGVYRLGFVAVSVLLALVVSQNVLAMSTSIQRAFHRYEMAMAGTRAPVVLSALVLLALFAAGALQLKTALVALAASYAGSAVWVGVRQDRRMTAGSLAERRLIPNAVIRRGLFFLGLSASLSIMVALDKLVIGKLMTYADLAVYATIFAIMKGYDFLFYSISYVLMPRVNAVERVPLRDYNISLAVLAAVVTGAYMLFGKEIVHLLFDGQYDQGTFLILPFALCGVAKLFYSVPSSVVGARLPERALRQFLWFNLGGVVVNVLLDIVMIQRIGLLGAAIATAIAWLLRLTGGYVVIWLNREHLARAPEKSQARSGS